MWLTVSRRHYPKRRDCGVAVIVSGIAVMVTEFSFVDLIVGAANAPSETARRSSSQIRRQRLAEGPAGKA